MFTYQINIEYLGTNFVGWQFQKNGVSVQEVLEKALSKLLKDKIKDIAEPNCSLFMPSATSATSSQLLGIKVLTFTPRHMLLSLGAG